MDFDESDSVSDQPYINEAPEKPELPTESIGHDNEKIGQDNRLIDRATGALGNDYSRLRNEREEMDPPGWDQAQAQEKAVVLPLIKFLTSSVSDKVLEQTNFGAAWQTGVTKFASELGVGEGAAAILGAIAAWAAITALSSTGEEAAQKTTDILYESQKSYFDRVASPAPSNSPAPSGVRVLNLPRSGLRENRNDNGTPNPPERLRKP